MGRRILVVEDDVMIAEAVDARLSSEGFEVEVVHDGLLAVEAFDRRPADLVVLDLMLPGIDGLEVCRRIQRAGHVPVVMLTARDDETDLLVGLAVGADDYLTKPFSPRELVARVHAVLRRSDSTGGAGGATAASAGVIDAGALRVDLERRRVWVDGIEARLTPTEFELLASLARRPGTPRTRLQLLDDVWNQRDGSGVRTVDSHIRALRRKLGPDTIRTHHGFGYSLEVDG